MVENELDNTKILIVDDDPIQRMLFKQSLKHAQYTVLEAKNGAESIELFKEHMPSLIIMDVEMPVMNGFVACEHIRDLDEGKFVSIIVTTGLEDDESISKAYNSGATDFIVKPFNWTIIKHRIKYMLRSHGTLTELNQKRQDNSAILKAIPDTIITLSQDGHCTQYYHGSITNEVLPSSIKGQNINKFLSEDALEVFNNSLECVLDGRFTRTFEFSQKRGSKTYFFETRLVPKGINEALAIMRDITGKKEDEHKIWKLAYYDSLTGLPNRQMFRERLAKMLIHAKKMNKLLSVAYIDLDKFNQVNNTFGHHIGDKLLKMFVTRLESCFRKSDCVAIDYTQDYDNQIARLGGDEFVVMLTDVDKLSSLPVVAQRVMATLSEPFEIDNMEIFVTPSIGFATYPDDGECVDSLLKNANNALDYAKKAGRNKFHIYDAKLSSDNSNYLKLETDLRRAIDNHELELFYQPQIDLSCNKISSAEALIRWRHPDLGIIAPATFIPIAEEIGIINEMGFWVIENACKQLCAFKEEGVILDSIGVNLSAQQFINNNLVEQVDTLLSKYKLDPNQLDLEITETTIMLDAERAIKSLNELKEIGVDLSIDDFGTGYSSLSYLQKFPLDKLKIDRSFISQLEVNRLDEKIIKVIISLADVLGLDVIAEGVENATQLKILQKYHCKYVQGYYYSRPVPANEFKEYYLQYNAQASKQNSA